MTHCTQKEFKFQGLKKRKVIGKFSGGTVTSDAGSILLGEIETRRGILRRLAGCFRDYRNSDYVEHSVEELVSQRIYAIALGYEDLNDHDELRRDPILATLSGKADPTGQSRKREQDRGNALAGKSTLNRLERTLDTIEANTRYHKIVYEAEKINALLVEIFLESFEREPEQIILDLDTTDDRIHGKQEGRFFHGYYGSYCYLPLYIFCGDHLLCAQLNTADKGATEDAEKQIQRIVGHIRGKWKHVQIIVRGDSHFARESLMAWCEDNKVKYIFGLAKNNRLKKEIEQAMEQAQQQYEETGNGHRIYREFMYSTLKSWRSERRVVGKAEYLEKGENPRFVVTSLTPEEAPAQQLYEQTYCLRSEMENRIKEQQLYLFADRTSSHTMRANQLRLWFSSFAYVLLNELRRIGLRGTEWSRAQCHTIRNKVLKIGAQVYVSVRRVYIAFASSYPYQEIFTHIYQRLHGPPFSVAA